MGLPKFSADDFPQWARTSVFQDVYAAIAGVATQSNGGQPMNNVAGASGPELRLLLGYARMLVCEGDALSPELAALAANQMRDLLALLRVEEREETETTRGRGLGAVRLAAIKRDIAEHIADSDLSIGNVAGRQGISPQYIRALFHREGTSFGDFVTKMRVELIHRQLRSPLYAGRSISTLAFDMGFNNLSWFNRAFKQRFGATPSEVREAAAKRTSPLS